MRWMVAILLIASAGCSDRRTFDERYDQTERRLEQKAQRLDNAVADKADTTTAESAE